MTASDIKTLGYRIYEAFNARDIAAAEELFAPDFISHALVHSHATCSETTR